MLPNGKIQLEKVNLELGVTFFGFHFTSFFENTKCGEILKAFLKIFQKILVIIILDGFPIVSDKFYLCLEIIPNHYA
jgi:hypothetical protein